MAKLLKLRRGTTSQHASFTGAEGEVTIDTTKDTAVVHDGSTAGGKPLAKEDMTNVSSAAIAGQLGTSSIANTKLADSGVSAGTVGSSTAIPIVTVNSKGIVTNTSTTAVDATKIENGSAKVQVASNGPITSTGNHDFTAGIDVTGNITATGTVDGRDVAADGSKLDGIESGATADQSASEILTAVKTVDGSGSGLDADTLDGLQGSSYRNANNINAGTVSSARLDAATTQSAGNNTTKIATTAFVQTAVAGVVDSAPTALNTLNELAAALGDDANYATTTANTIGTKLPKSGGQMTGNITFSGSQTVDGRDVSADGSKLDGIESGATADQSASEILTAIKTVDGAGSGLDADTLDGLNAAENGNSARIVRTNSSGYIFANYFNTSPNDIGNGSITKICAESGDDGYIRHAGAIEVRTFLNVANGATNVTNNNQLSNGAGYITSSGTAASFSAGSASNLNSGTLPDGRFPSTLPAVSGANLTNLPASVSIGGGWTAATGSGSVTVPSGKGRIWIFAQAGGGGGGGDFYGYTCNAHAGSGGNGGYVYRDFSVSAGQTVSYNMGGGGHGGSGACHVNYNGHGGGSGSGGNSTVTINGSQRITLTGGSGGGHAANWYGCHNGGSGSSGNTHGTHANDSRNAAQEDSAALNKVILDIYIGDNSISLNNGGAQSSGSCQAPGPAGGAGYFIYGFST